MDSKGDNNASSIHRHVWFVDLGSEYSVLPWSYRVSSYQVGPPNSLFHPIIID